MDPAAQKLPFLPPSLCCFVPSEHAEDSVQALCSLAAVEGRAREKSMNVLGRRRRAGAEGRHWVSRGLLEMMLSGYECTGRRHRTVLITALLQSKMGGRRPMNGTLQLQPSREKEEEAVSCRRES